MNFIIDKDLKVLYDEERIRRQEWATRSNTMVMYAELTRMDMMKHCNHCHIEKPLDQFYKNKTGKYGVHVECKDCSCLRTKECTARNPEKRQAYTKQWKLDNAEHVRKYNQEYCAAYYEKNKATLIPKGTAYTTNRRRTNINVRLAANLRRRLTHAIRGTYKVGSAVRNLGCSIEELKVYLEKKFTEGMTWENYGFGKDKWNVDHIKPLSKFELTDKEQFLQANHFSNLQPLWQIPNFKKGNR